MERHYANTRRLLDRVCYLSAPTVKARDIRGNQISVRDTFPYNPDSKTAPETAKRWVSNAANSFRRTKSSKKGPEPVERANDPFSITIIDLDVRSEGGRAYKVIDDENRRFDLREDQVIETLRNVGVNAGGKVPGQFVWGILGSQVRMVLVGGELHTEMVKQAETLRDFKRMQASGSLPTENTFKFGHVYRKRDGSRHAFLGRVKVPGNDKVLSAFVVMPEKPEKDDDYYTDNAGDERLKQFYRIQKSVIAKWDDMTWEERCQWEWQDSEWLLQTDGELHPVFENIVLMSSPKFEAEDASSALNTWAKQLRTNAGSNHKYVNGYGDDLAESWWLHTFNNGQPRRYDDGPVWCTISYDERCRLMDEQHQKDNKARFEARELFQKEMVWL